MRLTELEAAFIKRTGIDSWQDDATFADCDGLQFLCPKCWQANQGPVGTHSVICWKPGVPAEVTPGPGRWTHQGSGLEDLTLVAGSSSIQLHGGCNAHFWIRGGAIADLT